MGGAAPSQRSATLREATPGDAGKIHEIYAPIVRETPISFELDVPSVDDMRARIEATLAAFPYLVAEADGEILGYAYAGPYRPRRAYGTSVEVTVYVSAAARGRGVGRSLYGALLPDLAARAFHAAVAGITLPNPRSIALHEHFGFRNVGVFHEVGFKGGRYHDVSYWQRLL